MICANLSKAAVVLAMLGILSISAADAVAQPPDSAPVEQRSGPRATEKHDEANGQSSSPKAGCRRAWLGVDLLDTASGVRIDSVVVDSPASKAGLQPGDRIVGVNGTERPTAADVADAIAELNPGDRVTIDIVRNDERHEISATLDAAPPGRIRVPLEKAWPHHALRPSADLSREVEQLRRRIESLEKQVESLRRELSEMQHKAGSGAKPQEKPDKLPPAGGAIEMDL